MSALDLSDELNTRLLTAAASLPRAVRDDFISAVVANLQAAGVVGPGTLDRVIRAIQPRYFDPPDLADHRSAGKYGRTR
jgi:hypothetical protein